MVPVEQLIVGTAQVLGTGAAELRGLLATTLLMFFQFVGAAEPAYVTNLYFLAYLDPWTGNGAGTGSCDGDSTRLRLPMGSGSGSRLPTGMSFRVGFPSRLGFHRLTLYPKTGDVCDSQCLTVAREIR